MLKLPVGGYYNEQDFDDVPNRFFAPNKLYSKCN